MFYELTPGWKNMQPNPMHPAATAYRLGEALLEAIWQWGSRLCPAMAAEQ